MERQPSKLDVAGSNPVSRSNPSIPADSPDGSRIVFGCDGSVCLMDADGSNVDTLISKSGFAFNHFAWGG